MINFYEIVQQDAKPKNPNFKHHGIEVPFRAIIAAPSGSGKTNQLMNLLVAMDGTFNKVIICVKSADEPLYQHIIKKLKDRVEVYENGEVPPLESGKDANDETKKESKKESKKTQTLIIFDDLMFDNSPEILQYYIRGRKKGFSCVYIAQNFYGIPINIRKNSDYVFLGRNLNKRDITSILSLYPSKLDIKEFSAIYTEATKEPLDVLLLDNQHKSLRYNIADHISDF